jgi:oligopeptide/dipeptide ABC transporter ATP-binding protein
VGEKRRRVRLSGEAAEIKEIPPGCRFHPRCPLAKEVCSIEEPQDVTVAQGRWAACHFAQDVYDTNKLKWYELIADNFTKES